MTTRTIILLGNPVLPEDSAPPKLQPELERRFPNLTFIHLDPTEEIPTDDPQPVFIDSVAGIDRVTVFSTLAGFTPPPRTTVHDFDLFTTLALLTKLGKISQFTIIGIPQGMEEAEALAGTISVLRSI